MRILTWNILHGGGPSRLPEIILSLLTHKPDLLVLTEFRTPRGSQIRAVLADHGLTHQLTSHDDRDNSNGILIAARCALEPDPHDQPPPRSRGRWLAAHMPAHDLYVLGVHVPDDTRLTAKAAYWQAIVALGRRRRADPALILGDFNTGRRFQDGPDPGAQRANPWASIHGCEELLGTLLTLGFVDCWRRLHPSRREYSWASPQGDERRIDAIYVSPPLAPKLQAAVYSQVERTQGLSDHAPLLVDLDLEPRPASTAPALPQVHTRRVGLFGHPDESGANH
jgi:exonuclease III